MDPFVTINIKGEKFKTPVHNNGHRNPKWNFSFIANLDGDEDGLHVKLMNKGNITDDTHSRCDILLPEMDLSGKPNWYSLRDPENFSKECGDVSLTIIFEGSGLPPNSKAFTSDATRRAPAAVASPVSPASAQQVQPVASPQAYQSPPPQQVSVEARRLFRKVDATACFPSLLTTLFACSCL
jgi:hypothetical protein